MTPSTRTPSVKQTQSLVGVQRHGLATTEQIHAFREQGLAAAGKKPEKQRDTYALLVTCQRYEWLEFSVTDEEARAASPNDGAGKSWTLTTAGTEALERGKIAAAEANTTKGEDVGTTTEAPPEQAPAWGGGGSAPRTEDDTTTPETPVDEQALGELDGEGDASSEEETVPAEEVEVEEPVTKETHVVEGSNQLTMLVVPKGSRLKPKQFTLSMRGRQQEFGTTREYLMGERIHFTGVIEVDEVRTKTKKDGSVVKIALAKIAECDLLDEAPE